MTGEQGRIGLVRRVVRRALGSRRKTRALAFLTLAVAAGLFIAATALWSEQRDPTYLATGTLISSQSESASSSAVDRADVWSASAALDTSDQIEAANRSRLFDADSITITVAESDTGATADGYLAAAQAAIDELNEAIEEAWPDAVAEERRHLDERNDDATSALASATELYGEGLLQAITQSSNTASTEMVRGLAAGFDQTAYEFAAQALEAIAAQKTLGLVERELVALTFATAPQFSEPTLTTTYAPRPTLASWLGIGAVVLSLLGLVLALFSIGRKSVRRLSLLVLFVVMVVGVGLSIVTGLRLRDEAETIRIAADRIEDQLDNELEIDTLNDELTELIASIDAARSTAVEPWVRPARFLPTIGEQYDSALDLVDEVLPALHAAVDLLEEADVSAEGLRSNAMTQTEAVAVLRAPTVALREEIVGLVDYSPGPLPTDVAEKWESLRERAASSTAGLDRLEAALAIVTSVQSGERWLLVGGNTAEQKAGFGGFLQLGLMDANREGDIRIGELRGTGSHGIEGFWAEPNPDDVPLTEEELFHQDYFTPNDRWAKIGFDPYFDHAARMAAAMWESIGEDPVDGVLYLDPVAMALLLDETGPIQLDGEDVDGDRLLQIMFEGQYELTNRASRQDEAERVMRASALGLFDLDPSSASDLATIARVFDTAASERHLVAWHREQEVQSLIERGDLAGTHDAGSFFSWLFVVAGKFDAYLDATNTLDVECGSGVATITMTMDYEVELDGPLENGGFSWPDEWDFPEATYLTVAGVKFPQSARQIDAPKFDGAVSRGRLRSSDIHTGMIKIDDGDSYQQVMRFEMPAPATLTIGASGRLGPSRWRAGSDEWDGRAARDVAICQ